MLLPSIIVLKYSQWTLWTDQRTSIMFALSIKQFQYVKRAGEPVPLVWARWPASFRPTCRTRPAILSGRHTDNKPSFPCASGCPDCHSMGNRLQMKNTIPPLQLPHLCCFSIAALRVFFSFSVFRSFTVLCLDAKFLSLLQGVHLTSWICGFMSLIKFGNWLEFVTHGFFSLFFSPTLFPLSVWNSLPYNEFGLQQHNVTSFVVPQVPNTLFVFSPNLFLI